MQIVNTCLLLETCVWSKWRKHRHLNVTAWLTDMFLGFSYHGQTSKWHLRTYVNNRRYMSLMTDICRSRQKDVGLSGRKMQTYVKQYIYVYVFKKKKTRVMFDRHMSEKQLHNGVFWVFSRFYRYRTVFVYVSRQSCQIDRKPFVCPAIWKKIWPIHNRNTVRYICQKRLQKAHFAFERQEVGLPDTWAKLRSYVVSGWNRSWKKVFYTDKCLCDGAHARHTFNRRGDMVCMCLLCSVERAYTDTWASK